MSGKRWGVAAFIALFSPRAWRAAGKTVEEAIIIVRNMALAAAAVVGGVSYWLSTLSQFHQLVVAGTLAGLFGLWVYSKVAGNGTRPSKRYRGAVPTQVLYRWYEPTDLPLSLRCRCGKRREPGELVYVGITGAHRSRELDDDRQVACWWTVEPPVVGTQQLYRTRNDVEAAEIVAIRAERPRENKQHAVGWRP